MEKIRVLLEALYNNKRFNIIAFGIIAAMVLIAYSNTFTASFHFDDYPAIIENPNIRHVTMDNIISLLQANRPVVYFSLMLNYQLSGVNVVGWHIFNIGVHIATSCFVYLLMLWTLTLPSMQRAYDAKARWMALFGALLFGVHPVQTESVTYIITRTELLATFFYLLAFLFFIRGTQTKKIEFYVATVLSSALSMGSKEWAVTLPAILLLYDYLFIAEKRIPDVLRRWPVYLGVILSTWIVLRTLNLFAQGGAAGIGFNVASQTGLGPKSYFLTSLNVLWTYIRLLFLPINQNLDYDYRISKTLFEFPTLLSFIGHLAVCGATFWAYKKKGWLLIPFGIVWFYIGLSPVQSIVPIIDVIFEHRLYMPSIGIFLAFIVAFEGCLDWWEVRKLPKTGMAG